MKISIKTFLIAFILVAGMAMQAQAQQSPTTSTPSQPYNTKGANHPCMSEHQAVVAACEKGDPCGAQCKQAHKAMKQCRMANNLPTKPHTGAHKPSPCKTQSGSPGMTAPTTTPQAAP